MPSDKGYRNTYTSPTRRGPSKGTNASSNAARRSGKRSWQQPGGAAPQYDREFRQAIAGNPNLSYNQTAYNAFAHQMALGPGSLGPGGTIGGGGGGGGGGRGYGGGGGGGGGGGMTQAMFDQMVAALGQRAPQLALQQQALPAFQGQNIAAFNAAPYDQAAASLAQAVTADQNAVAQNAANTTNALGANYTNSYANAQVTPGATQAPVGAGLQATAGGGGYGGDANQQAAQGANAANGDSQAAFANLLQVLAANSDQSQQSRLGQVAMDQGTAMNSIGAQNLGLGAGINMARTQGQQQWAQQDAERRYQNSLMGQTWNRESLTRNQDLQNQQRQLNWQQMTAQQQARLQPILDLIASGRGLNTAALTALLGRQQ